jgi:cyclopropane-fatty-acyl-phospholipid synthase
MRYFKNLIEQLINPAGITIGGTNAWDVQVHDERLYQRIINGGSLGLGESYMDGWWDCCALDQFFYRLLSIDTDKRLGKNLALLWGLLMARLFNQQTPKKATEVGLKHYDAGNTMFELMLDKYMMYSCGYWNDASTLDEAQEKKLDLICRKLQLEPGQRVLDIGCGWGGFARYAAEKYGVNVTGITISKEQAALARERCQNFPVEIRLQDYRDIDQKFDRIVSIGMFEHVGYKNYHRFMQVASRSLTDEGIFLLHCIGCRESGVRTDPWIHKYIFPNGLIPSVIQVSKAINNYFILEDWHNFGEYYDLTLMAWLKRFREAWPQIKQNYSEEFYRMWNYYLNLCAASFRARKNELWQLVLTKPQRQTMYMSVR